MIQRKVFHIDSKTQPRAGQFLVVSSPGAVHHLGQGHEPIGCCGCRNGRCRRGKGHPPRQLWLIPEGIQRLVYRLFVRNKKKKIKRKLKRFEADANTMSSYLGGGLEGLESLARSKVYDFNHGEGVRGASLVSRR